MNQETYPLSAQKRDCSQKNSARVVRGEGRVPAVVYGHGTDPITISIDASDILRTYRKAGTSALIDLDVDGKKVKVLVQELLLHPVTNNIYHVDFFAVNLKEKTTVNVPLNFIGESPAVKDLGGLFMKDTETVEVRCLPSDIPHSLDIDLALITEVGGRLTLADLVIDREQFELPQDEMTLLCSVIAPKTAEQEEAENAAADAAIAEGGEEGEEVAEGEEGAEGETSEGEDGEEGEKKEEGGEDGKKAE
jgi:large subunit ribosomal protein L25